MSATARSPTIVLLVDADGRERIVGRLDGRRADLALVDALARLQLAARRRDRRLCVRDPTAELRGLVELVGLTDALGVEPRGQPEVGEVLGADEVVQSRDPPA